MVVVLMAALLLKTKLRLLLLRPALQVSKIITYLEVFPLSLIMYLLNFF
jgi:hypothetical protein